LPLTVIGVREDDEDDEEVEEEEALAANSGLVGVGFARTAAAKAATVAKVFMLKFWRGVCDVGDMG
jgi:hypothetical protein